MKKFVIFAMLLLLAAIGCGGGKGEVVKAELPILEVGNKWVYKWVAEDIDYTCTIEVTGEDTVDGKDCYITQWSFEPALEGVANSATVHIEKATYREAKGQMTGQVQGLPYSLVTTSSYTFPEGSGWPLEVGKEISATETTTTTITARGQTETETETETYTYKVEKVEEITVAAGTFKCLKVVRYDDEGKKSETSWHSDKVRNDVKWIDHESGDYTELRSYSL